MSPRPAFAAALLAVSLTACGSPAAAPGDGPAAAADDLASGQITIVADTRHMGVDRTGDHRFTGGPDRTCAARTSTGQLIIPLHETDPEGIDNFRIEAPLDTSGPASVGFSFQSENAGTDYDSDYADSSGHKGSATGTMTRKGARLEFSFEGMTWDKVQFRGSGSCLIG